MFLIHVLSLLGRYTYARRDDTHVYIIGCDETQNRKAILETEEDMRKANKIETPSIRTYLVVDRLKQQLRKAEPRYLFYSLSKQFQRNAKRISGIYLYVAILLVH